MRPHCFAHLKAGGKPYCCVCGLLMLRNKATLKAIQRGCPDRED